jgi:hypothetical protein
MTIRTIAEVGIPMLIGYLFGLATAHLWRKP